MFYYTSTPSNKPALHTCASVGFGNKWIGFLQFKKGVKVNRGLLI
jgi:hypothetical protein